MRLDAGPFADLLGLRFLEPGAGLSRCTLEVVPNLLNPHRVLHGGVLYSMADTGMGAALYSLLEEGQACATVEVTIAYLQAVRSGTLVCDTKVIQVRRTLAFLESHIENDGRLVARAMGTFAVTGAR